MVTPRVDLTIKGTIDSGVFFLQGGQNMLHEHYNTGTVLVTLFNYVHKGLRLQLTLLLSDCHSDVPGKPLGTAPAGSSWPSLG